MQVAINFVLNQMVDTEINSDDTINSIRSESIDIKVLVLNYHSGHGSVAGHF